MAITGSCLCGGVIYQLEGDMQLLNHCHCANCRKASGAAFGTFLHASTDQFTWLSGEELVTRFRSSEHGYRSFCNVCGSNMPTVHEAAGRVIVPAGTLDDDPGIRPSVHFFTSSKVPWYDIADGLDQFEAFPTPEWLAGQSAQ